MIRTGMLAVLALALTACGTMDLNSLTKASLVERGFLPRSESPNGPSIELWYSYPHPTDDRLYANVFRMGIGTIIAINLAPEGKNGVFTGDALTIADLTDPNAPWVQHRAFWNGAEWEFRIHNGYYRLKVISHNNEQFAVLTDTAGTSAVVSIDALYRWRVMAAKGDMKIGETNYKYLHANTSGVGTGSLFFSEKCQAAVLDPAAPRTDLLATYFVIYQINNQRQDEMLIGGSGYKLKWNGTKYEVQFAK
jgi:hypothetical protein